MEPDDDPRPLTLDPCTTRGKGQVYASMRGMSDMGSRCWMSQGSTTPEGKRQAPDRCRLAVLEAYKTKIEACEIEHEHLCPLRCFIGEVRKDDDSISRTI
jgi:hypothetical protein